ncbi:hypothetical protein GCM10010193_15410 [Kitasatospora atroaurantiaca]|uniref:non-specific serine/threonine protein kinase n=1 Tax=Kitasatospora atroaurantiaca TaxID=285545 RepID=A0A561EII5_9ACTN|nr:serine/threonine-protein kinase [Kitasatospora atroaurantiaca]TWE15428.1 serine/threonine-protein kinase [Kitasatospora atroaurantiaca]
MEDERATVHGHKGAVPEDARWELPGYTHGRELGSGASGRVVLAHHDATGTPVAIKYLSGEAAGNESFRAEAELLGRLDSPYVTRLYEYVEGPRGAAIVMELVDGIALRTLLREEGATQPEAALTVLKGSLLGLAAAHAAGVVHRDYKPGNVLVAADGSSKLVDFGIAVPRGDSADIAGTPAYMAPEQWAGSPASPSADVYAATATFFECLTGAKPYAGTTLLELAVQHTEAAVPDDQAPEALRPLIRAGLAKTPQERPESAAALVTQLEAVASAAYGEDWEERGRRQLAALVALLPLLLPGAGGQVAGTTALATTTLAPPLPRPSLGASRRAKLLAAATAVVILGGTLAGVAAAGSTDDAGHTTVGGPAPELTSTLAPPPSGGPSAALPSPSPSPSASTASASPSVSPTLSPSPSTTPTHASATPSASPTPSPSPTFSAPSLHVISIVLEAYGCYGRYGTVASVTVITDGAADGKLTLSWIDRSGRTLQTQAVDTITLPKGKTQISNRYTHTFGSQDNYPTWGVRIATDPAADKGQNTYRELYAPSCNPPR